MITPEYLTGVWGFVMNEYGEYCIIRDGVGPTVMYLHCQEWLLTGESPDGRVCIEEKVITTRSQIADLMKVLEIECLR